MAVPHHQMEETIFRQMALEAGYWHCSDLLQASVVNWPSCASGTRLRKNKITYVLN